MMGTLIGKQMEDDMETGCGFIGIDSFFWIFGLNLPLLSRWGRKGRTWKIQCFRADEGMNAQMEATM